MCNWFKEKSAMEKSAPEKKRIRKRAHTEKSSRGIKRSRKKAQIQLF